MNAFMLLLLHFSFSSVSLVLCFSDKFGASWMLKHINLSYTIPLSCGLWPAIGLFLIWGRLSWKSIRGVGAGGHWIKSYLSKNTCPFTAHIHTDTQTCNRSLGYRSGLWSQASDCCSICWGMLIHVIMTWGAGANWYELNCRWNFG